MQAAVPLVFLYLPATHATHGPPSGPVYPTLHGHRLVPGTESEFGGHIWHSDEFRQFLYFPASHATHGPASGPVNPASQKHIVSPGTVTDLAAQFEQVSMEVACTAVEYVFAAHNVHASLPFVALYVPGVHVVHCPFEAP